MTKLEPYALKDAPNLIESGIFPVQKLSYEAQREKKSGSSQILTRLGSYWKGRKPLILVRAIILGLLLPKTGNDEADFRILEKLLAFDVNGLARRAYQFGKITPKILVQSNKFNDALGDYITTPNSNSKIYRWKKDVSEEIKIELIEHYLCSFSSYSQQAEFCKRPEEIDPDWLYRPIWPIVWQYYAEFGITASTFDELTEQFGILRFGHRLKVGDPFAGGGSIPFESGRVGCDVNAADINPIACMLNWAAFNIIGSTSSKQTELLEEIQRIQECVLNAVQSYEIETNNLNERANAYLYCLETRCPETGWRIPLSGSWIISKRGYLITKLVQDNDNERFDFELTTAESDFEMAKAKLGSIQNDKITYEIDNKKYCNSIKHLRGDHIDSDGFRRNNLRPWEKSDIVPQENDVFTERLYAVQWIRYNDSIGRNETIYRPPDTSDIEREERVRKIVKQNLKHWQSSGLIPSKTIEHGQKTTEPIRTRGWTHWHHFFNPRQLFLQKLLFEQAKSSKFPSEMLVLATRSVDWNNRGCRWIAENGVSTNLFYNQAYNLIWNYCSRGSSSLLSQWKIDDSVFEKEFSNEITIGCKPASDPNYADVFITDPPYADAICYHEITEIFISWFEGELPAPFSDWKWDSRRQIAIKGSGFEFKHQMIEAYSAMSARMPDNGYQCVMFTHSNVKVWADLTNILWASGLQVVSAWCVATEKSNSFRDGNHIQGTVVLILRKRPSEPKTGYKHIVLSRITNEVVSQIELMLNLIDKTRTEIGEHVFSDSDIRLAGQAAALRVLTSYSSIGGEDVKSFAVRSLNSDSPNVVEEIVLHAIEIADSFLSLESMPNSTWTKLTGIERFYLQMIALNSTKIETYQNYARIYRVDDYKFLLTNTKANHAKLKLISEFTASELGTKTEFGRTWLGQIIKALQKLVKDNAEPLFVISDLQNDVADFLLAREDLSNLLKYIEIKSPENEIRESATLLKGQLRNLRIFNQ